MTLLGMGDKLAEVAVTTAELAHFNKFASEIWREPRGALAMAALRARRVHMMLWLSR